MNCKVCGLYMTEVEDTKYECEMCYGDEEKLMQVIYDTYSMFIQSGFKDIKYDDFRFELGDISELETRVDEVIELYHYLEIPEPYGEEKLSELNKLYKDKNSDYGDSFGKSFKEYGDVAYFIRASDKVNRLYNLLYKGVDRKVGDEKVIDTVDDLLNYTIMYGIEIVNQEFKYRRLMPKYMTHEFVCEMILSSGVDKVVSKELHDTAIETLYSELANDFAKLKKTIKKSRVDKMEAILKLSKTTLLLSEVLYFDN